MQEKQQLTLSSGVKSLRTKVAMSDQFLSELMGSLCKRSAGATQAKREREDVGKVPQDAHIKRIHKSLDEVPPRGRRC